MPERDTEKDAFRDIADVQNEVSQLRASFKQEIEAEEQELELRHQYKKEQLEAELAERKAHFDFQMANEREKCRLEIETWRLQSKEVFAETRRRVAAQLALQLKRNIDLYIAAALQSDNRDDALKNLGEEARAFVVKVFAAKEDDVEAGLTDSTLIRRPPSAHQSWLSMASKYLLPVCALAAVIFLVAVGKSRVKVKMAAMSSTVAPIVSPVASPAVGPDTPPVASPDANANASLGEKSAPFQLLTTPFAKSNYTDDVAYTTSYLEAYMSQEFQQEWIVSLTEFFDKTLDIDAEFVVRFIPKEKSFLRTMGEIREKIDASNAENSLRQMRGLEQEFVQNVSTIFRHKDNFVRFMAFRGQFFDQHQKRLETIKSAVKPTVNP